MSSQARNNVAKVLPADDVKLFLEIEKSFFSRAGFKVFTAHSGVEVITIAGREKPDIILMDYEMPGMKGDEVCQALRANKALRHIPVVIVSQHYSQEILERCVRAGCSDYLTKPVDQQMVLRRVAELLNITNRRYLRVTVILTVNRGGTKTQFLGHAQNISESGIYLETHQALKEGGDIQMSFFLPDAEEKITAPGKVIRVVEDSIPGQFGVGIRFGEMSDSAREILQRYVEKKGEGELPGEEE